MKKVLFVCLGNICRSPLAEGVARSLASKYGLDLQIDSAGTSNWHEGEPPCDRSIAVAARHGVDISSQRSRPIAHSDLDSFYDVIAMDRSNLSDLEAFGFKNVTLIGTYGGYEGADVPDPYHFHGSEGFEAVYEMIETCVRDLLETMQKR
jgi:protein-tyrosine phosphatase